MEYWNLVISKYRIFKQNSNKGAKLNNNKRWWWSANKNIYTTIFNIILFRIKY